MSLMTGFAILVGEAIIGFYKKVHAINFGVYGATMVGKTTLSHQLRTRGEVPTIQERTIGKHRASRKTIKIDGQSHTVRSADIGGEAIYWKEWEKTSYNLEKEQCAIDCVESESIPLVRI